MRYIKGVIIYCIYKLYLFITVKIGFTHYYILSRNIPVHFFNKNLAIVGNICYGNIYAVKNALKKEFDKHCIIEHGLHFARYVTSDNYKWVFSEINTIYTFGQYREEVLKEYFGNDTSKKIIKIGPYIHFAKDFYSDARLKKIKQKIGKTLLVFPTHSSPENLTSFDYEAWITEIKRCAVNFDTVIISLFWLDINNGNYKHYLQNGFQIACCGNRFDTHFLSREKSLIKLSDMTMSNDVGTHIGYCVALGKPHYIYHQEIKIEYYKEYKDQEEVFLGREYMKIWERERMEFFDAFSSFEERITEKQKKLVDYYWGKTNCV